MNRISTCIVASVIFATSASAQSMSKPYATVEASRVIDAPIEKVWQAMVLDYGNISNFSPYIYSSGYQSGSLEGVLGAERKCDFDETGKRWSHERIAAIDHDKHEMKNIIVDAAKFPLNLDNSYAIYKVSDNGNGTSTASYTFHFRTKPGIMTGLVKGSFRKTLQGTLIGLEHYIETGEPVNGTSGNWKAIEKAAQQGS